MRATLLMLLLAFFPALALANGTPAFYVCAHPDDCILFMNPNLYDNVAQGTDKTVILYLTSGEDGAAFSKETNSYPYAREQAALDATEWMANADHSSATDAVRKTEAVAMHGHALERVTYANTVSYFLRLPDGKMYGEGDARYGKQSMQKLKTGAIPQLQSIDGNATYANWQDLLDTLSAIVAQEAGDAKQISVHMADPDASVNVGDHSDHLHAAHAMVEILSVHPADRCTVLYKHIGYSIAEKSPNLDPVSLQNKSGSFAVLTGTLLRFLGYHHWDKAHTPYLARNYFTTVTLPENCTAPR